MNIMKASRQWASRPADQRFWDLDELYSAVSRVRAHSVIGETPETDMEIIAENSDLRILNPKTGNQAEISHWAFGQLATRANAPAGYLRTLPAPLAAENLNHGLSASARSDRSTRMLIYQDPETLVSSDPWRPAAVVRSVATDLFSPIWNRDILDRVRSMPGEWRTPPARPAGLDDERTRIATAEDARYSISDAMGIGIKEGDTIAPAGLYASAEDMFVFLIDPGKVIRDGTDAGLQRGIIIQNAEVSGKLRFRMSTFFHRGVCGNHIIWNASGLTEIAVKHVGTAPERAFGQIQVTVRKYAESGASEDEARIQAAQVRQIASTKDEVLDALFKRSILSRASLEASYQAAEEHPEDGDPRTFWGFAQGITRVSQALPNADSRTAMDQAAGRVLTMAF